jgi:class 3 adenylate cyclase
MPDSVTQWLEQLGLGEYATAFSENDIDWELLPEIDQETLKEIGVTSAGHRLRIIKAVQKLHPDSGDDSNTAEPASDELEPLTSRGEAERRQITVMFCDLVGSTKLSQQLDPEDLRKVITACQDVWKAAIERYGGYIARYSGDGVLTYFGYPQAHEDDAERAVRASLNVVDVTDNLNADIDWGENVELAVRVGIATGPVIVGDLVGEGASQEHAAVGETPNLAARLQAQAKPQSVVVAPATHRLTKGLFSYESLGDRELKGIAEPTEIWRVVGDRSIESRFQATHPHDLTPLIGRDEELQMMHRRWTRTLDGEGEVVLLAGESGIGKSRLTDALRLEVASDPHVWIRYQCSPHHVNSPFYPLIAQLRYAAGLTQASEPANAFDQLEGLIGGATDALEDDLPLLANLLSIPVPSRYRESEMDPQARKTRTVQALVRQFRGLAKGTHVLCIFEDLHWADPSTLEVIDDLVQGISEVSALMVLTFRPEFTAPWTGQPNTTLLTLSRIGSRDSRRMIEAVFSNVTIPRGVIDSIATRADGVPLFIEELTQSVVEAVDLPAAADSSWSDVADSGSAIPETLVDSLMARLDRFPRAKEVAQVASVIGREFEYRMLEAVSNMPPENLRAGMRELEESGVVLLRGTVPDASCRFKHALVRDAGYATLTRERRQKHHASVARVMSELVDSGDRITEPEVIAYHYTEAESVKEAVPFWLQAAERARDRFANAELIEHAQTGLSLLDRYPQGSERDRLELEFQYALGLAFRSTKGFVAPEALNAFRRAESLSRDAEKPELQLECLRGIYNYFFVRGQLRDGRPVAEQALAVARGTGVARHLHMAASLVGSYWLYTGHPAEGHRWHEQATREQPAGKQQAYPSRVLDANAAARMNLSWALWLVGLPDQASNMAEQAWQWASRTENPFPQSVVLVWICGLQCCLGRLIESEDRVRELVAMTREHDIAVWRERGQFLEGKLSCLQGRGRSGLRTMRGALDDLRKIGGRQAWTWLLAETATECIQQGDPTSAFNLLDEAFDQKSTNDERYWEAELHRLRGEAMLASKDRVLSSAEACFHEALSVAMDQGSKALALRAATSLARLRAETGRRDEARSILARAYGEISEGFDTADLREAKTLIEELS